MKDWRRIEQALVDHFRSIGWDVDRNGMSGDVAADSHDTTIDLTALAKHLADEMANA